MMARLLAGALVLLGACGCTSYEYEEEAFLDVDGSGTIRVSGSREILEALHGGALSSAEALSTLVAGDDVALVSTRETERANRRFFHVEGSFLDWNDLCHRPWFQDRRCRLRTDGDEDDLLFSFPAPVPVPAGGSAVRIDPDSILAVRVHFSGTVRYHNARGDVERGNIVSWKRTAREYFGGAPLEVEARFDRESIFSATVRVLLLAIAFVAAVVAIAIYLMVRKGRKQLAADQGRG
jgi:hypothetical protein